MRTYPNLTAAIQYAIVDPLEAAGITTNAWHDFNIQAIADEVIMPLQNSDGTHHGHAFTTTVEDMTDFAQRSARIH